MSDLANRIAALSDGDAVRIVESIARAQRPLVEPPPTSASLRTALRQEFGVEPSGEAPGEGDVARTTLLFLAEDPDYRPVVESRLEGGGEQRLVVGGVALATAVLTVLASSVEFEIAKDRHGNSSWRFHYKKPSIKAAAKPLVGKLLALLSG